MIIFVTGGMRSGKTAFAMQQALYYALNPVYIATAKIWDDEFQQRVQRHQEERGPEWLTYEAYRNLNLLPLQGRTVVIDCVTLWLTNFFMDFDNDIDKSFAAFKTELNLLLALDATFIIISNEIGMGLHADTSVGRKFTDLQGWANQYVAAKADKALLMVSGLPLSLK
jgi:adenosylcobinamide kinase/adenosylcobinamide-phosphate guanylyltransferase